MKISEFFKNNNFVNLTLLIIVVAVIYSVMVPMFNVCTLSSESLFLPFVSQCDIDNDAILQVFTSNTHQWFILSIFHVIADRYLPEIFDIHPQMMIVYFFKFFLFPLFFLLVFSIMENVYKYKEKREIWSPYVFLILFYIVYQIVLMADFVWVFNNDCWYYAYVFLPIFAILLYNRGEFFYVTQNKLTARDKVVIGCLTLFVSVSHEMFRAIFMSTILLVFILNKLFFGLKYSAKQWIKYIFAYIGLGLLNLVTIVLSLWYVERRVVEPDLKTLVLQIKTFLFFLYQNIVEENFWLFLIIVVLYLVVMWTKSDDGGRRKRLLICTAGYLLSTFLFMFCLFFFNVDGSDTYAVAHCGIRFIFSLIILQIVLSLGGYYVFRQYSHQNIVSVKDFAVKCALRIKKVVVNNENVRCFLNVFLKIVIIGLLLFVLVVDIVEDKDVIGLYNYNYKFRINTYILEKINMFNNLKHNTFYSCGDKIGFDGAQKLFIEYNELDNIEEEDIKTIFLCEKTDNIDVCKKKMLKFLQKKYKYKMTNKELSELDFDALYEIK